MAFAAVHQSRVRAERHVVQEEPVAGVADVDAALGPVERLQGCKRILPVEAEIAHEVVARAEGDADEGHVTLQRGLGD